MNKFSDYDYGLCYTMTIVIVRKKRPKARKRFLLYKKILLAVAPAGRPGKIFGTTRLYHSAQ